MRRVSLWSAPVANGEAMPASSRDAAQAHGLLHDDAETIATLRDALEYTQAGGSRNKIHELFAEALIWLDVADPVLARHLSIQMLEIAQTIVFAVSGSSWRSNHCIRSAWELLALKRLYS